MGIGSSSMCVLAVVTSSASLTMTHEEAEYYMVCGKFEAPPARESSHTLYFEHALDFAQLGHRVDRAGARAADGGRGVGEAEQILRRVAAQQAVDERAAEDVAGAGRVDGVDV